MGTRCVHSAVRGEHGGHQGLRAGASERRHADDGQTGDLRHVLLKARFHHADDLRDTAGQREYLVGLAGLVEANID